MPVANDSVAFNWAFAGTVVALTVGLALLYRPNSLRFDVDTALPGDGDGGKGGEGALDSEALLGGG